MKVEIFRHCFPAGWHAMSMGARKGCQDAGVMALPLRQHPDNLCVHPMSIQFHNNAGIRVSFKQL
jgi:hypothetical protein